MVSRTMAFNLSLKNFFLFLCFFILKSSPALSPPSAKAFQKPPNKFAVHFLNQQTLKYNLLFNKIPVGGLSGLHYHAPKKVFLALSDDKGWYGPPRFYTLQLHKKFLKTQYQLKIKSQTFLVNKKNRYMLPIDPEGISVLPNGQILISSEGAQISRLAAWGAKKSGLFKQPASLLLHPPGVFSFQLNGRLAFTWPLPRGFWPHNLKHLKTHGVQKNKAFESVSVEPGGQAFWLAGEAALRQDLLPSSPIQYIRLSRFHIAAQKMLAQFAYPASLWITQKHMKGLNGVTDLLALKNKQFLIIERAYLKDPSLLKIRKTDFNDVRLILADCSQADDISNYKSLKNKTFAPCKKIQTENISIGAPAPNIEGLAWGPKLKTGGRLLVFVSDNNFNSSQKTQFLFFRFQRLKIK